MLQKITLKTFPTFLADSSLTNLLRLDLLLAQQLKERLHWKMYKYKDKFFFEYWLMAEWLTVEYQRLIPGLTETLYKETFLGLNTLEPILDYITRYHTLGFNPDVKLDLEAHAGYYSFYVDQLRPYLWEHVAPHCPNLNMTVPGPEPAF